MKPLKKKDNLKIIQQKRVNVVGLSLQLLLVWAYSLDTPVQGFHPMDWSTLKYIKYIYENLKQKKL